jgi:hypothetical protein
LLPTIVTVAPTAPELVDKLLILGAATTVNATPLLGTLETVTTTFPVVAALGTVKPMLVAAQEDTVAEVPLNFAVLLPWLEPKLIPVMVTAAPTAPEVIERLVIPGVGRTVKLSPLLFTPLANTTTLPVVAPDGTVTPMEVALQLDTVAAVPLNLTVPLPWLAPKLDPVTVTAAPTAPDVIERLVMLGAETTVKLEPLLLTPLADTTTLPVVAPVGTVTPILVALQVDTVAEVPLNFTVPLPWLEPKFEPVMVTAAPTAPEVIERLVILGAGTTVNATPLLDEPDTVTTTLPVVAPVGTVTLILVEPHDETVAAVPLNLTVLEPCEEPKFVPVMVTEAPTAPVVTERLVMLGAVALAEAAKQETITSRMSTWKAWRNASRMIVLTVFGRRAGTLDFSFWTKKATELARATIYG